MKAKTNRFIFRWHRRLGITSALFVIVLCTTGLLLMFTSGLDLDRKRIGGGLIGKVYNLEPKADPVGVKLSTGEWVAMVDGLVYVGDATPVTLVPPLVGVAQTENLLLIKGADEILLMYFDGRLIERMPKGIEDSAKRMAAGLRHDQQVVDHFSPPTPLPPEIKKKVLGQYAGRGLPASRVLLDIHTGRFFGAFGTWLMIIATILLLFLSISGIIMWSGLFKHKGKYKRRW